MLSSVMVGWKAHPTSTCGAFGGLKTHPTKKPQKKTRGQQVAHPTSNAYWRCWWVGNPPYGVFVFFKAGGIKVSSATLNLLRKDFFGRLPA